VGLGVNVADASVLELSYTDATLFSDQDSFTLAWEPGSVGWQAPEPQPPLGPILHDGRPPLEWPPSPLPRRCLKLRIGEGIRAGARQPVEVLFVDSLAFRWQEGFVDHEHDDDTYEVINSAWLAEIQAQNEVEREFEDYRHLRLNFNEGGDGSAYLEVICRAVLVKRPAWE